MTDEVEGSNVLDLARAETERRRRLKKNRTKEEEAKFYDEIGRFSNFPQEIQTMAYELKKAVEVSKLTQVDLVKMQVTAVGILTKLLDLNSVMLRYEHCLNDGDDADEADSDQAG